MKITLCILLLIILLAALIVVIFISVKKSRKESERMRKIDEINEQLIKNLKDK